MSSWHLACLDIETFSDISPPTASPVFIDLSHNKIFSLSTFPSLPNLVELNLSSNRLTSLPPSQFPVLESLRHLDLSFNFLTSFAGLSLAPNLETLSLRGNKISHLSDFQLFFHSGLRSLSDLDLSSNSLYDLRQFFFLQKFPIKKIALAPNPLTRSPLYKIAILQSIDSLAFLDGLPIASLDRHHAKVTPLVFTKNMDISLSLDHSIHIVLSVPDGPAVIKEQALKDQMEHKENRKEEELIRELKRVSENQELYMIEKMEKQENEISDLKRVLQVLAKEKEKFGHMIKRTSDEKDKLKKDFELIEEAIEKKDRKFLEKISGMENILSRVQKENEELKMERSEIPRLKKEISELKEKQEVSVETKVLLERKTQEYARLEGEFKNEVYRWEREVEIMRNETLKREETLKQRLLEVNKTSDATVASLRSEIDNTITERNRLQSENLFFSETVKSTSDALKTALDENLSLTEANRSLTSLNQSLQTKIHKSVTNQDILERACKDELNTMSKRVKAAEILSKESQELASKANKDLEIIQTENSRLTLEINEKKSDLAISEAARRAAVAECATQIDQIANFRKSEIELISEVAAARAAAQVAEVRDRKSQEEISDLRLTFCQIERELDEYRARSESEISSLKKEREKISVHMANRDALLADLQSQVAENISELARAEEAKSLIAEKLRTSEAAIAYVQEEMEDMRDDFKRQGSEICDRDSDIAGLRQLLDVGKKEKTDLDISLGNLVEANRKLQEEVKERDAEMKILIVAMDKEKQIADEKLRKVKELFAM